MARSIVTPTDTMDFILESLFSFRFSIQQARIAEQWILFGDWTYRGRDAKLELSDFMNPPMDQVEAIAKKRDMVLMTHGEVAAMKQNAFEAGKRSGQAEVWQEEQKRNTGDL